MSAPRGFVPGDDEEYEAEHRARVGPRRDAGESPAALNRMLAAWAALVANVEDGYSEALLEEFEYDLGCRTWLADTWPGLPDAVRVARKAELADLDTRFRAATIDVGPGRPREGGQWWLRRRPSVVVG
ncbi:hypothetical protein JOF53_005955 [Crossiella equi]|uniref:Uncharacterized protein n=1 Tax=Crossiella equi TaxID=130796 RepID=A0ABS5AKI9_9PSEU|nr:hypothetical protein [Crossiella equi]MBP2477083.1 hypothetical protein [Crossiella equi]